MERIKIKLSSLLAWSYARWVAAAAVVLGLVVPAASASAAPVGLESGDITTPLTEYVGLIGAVLVGIIVAGFGGMAIVALGKAAFREGKHIIAKIV